MARKIIITTVLFSLCIIIAVIIMAVILRLPVTTQRVTNPVIAVTPDREIFFSDFKAWLKEKNIPDYALYDYVSCLILIKRALEDMVSRSETELFNILDKDESGAVVSQEDISAYYKRNKDLFKRKRQYRISHIRVGSPQELEGLKLKLGKDELKDEALRKAMTDLSVSYSDQETTNKRWGSIGWISKKKFPRWFYEKIKSLREAGDYVTFTSPFGYHLVMLMHIRYEKVFTLNEVRNYIAAKLREERNIPSEYRDIDKLFGEQNISVNIRNLKEALFTNKIGNMALIKGGQFHSGFNKEEIKERYKIWEKYVLPYIEGQNKPGWLDNVLGTYHRRWVRPFYIDRYEVSIGEYREFINATEHRPLPKWVDDLVKSVDHPALGVSWYDASSYCKWIGKRLPTQDEWEFAARGQERRRYPWGESHPDGKRGNFADKSSGLDWASRVYDDGYKYTAPVTAFPAGSTPEGVYNLAGNVKEWTQDTYFAKEKAITKGGSYFNSFDDMMAGDRRWYNMNTLDRTVGFRCACDIE